MISYVINFVNKLGFVIDRGDAKVLLASLPSLGEKDILNGKYNRNILMEFINMVNEEPKFRNNDRSANDENDVMSLFTERAKNREYVFLVVTVKKYLLSTGKYNSFYDKNRLTTAAAVNIISELCKKGYDYKRIEMEIKDGRLRDFADKYIRSDLLRLKSTQGYDQGGKKSKDSFASRAIVATVKESSISSRVVAAILAIFIVSNLPFVIKAQDTFTDNFWAKIEALTTVSEPYKRMSDFDSFKYGKIDDGEDKDFRATIEHLAQVFEDYVATDQHSSDHYEQICLFQMYESISNKEEEFALMDQAFHELQDRMKRFGSDEANEAICHYSCYPMYVYEMLRTSGVSVGQYCTAVKKYMAGEELSKEDAKALRDMMKVYKSHVNELEEKMLATLNKDGRGKK